MPIIIECPNRCRFRAPDRALNSKIRCPDCKSVLSINKTDQLPDGAYAAKLFHSKTSPDATPFVEPKTVTEPSQTEPEYFSIVTKHDRTAAKSESGSLSESNLADRVQSRLQGRRILTRVLAFGLMCLALIILGPAIACWQEWSQQISDPVPLPRWVYLSIFLAFLQMFYALLLYLVPDWSSLMATSGFLLCSACVMGIVGGSLAIPLTSNSMAGFLQVIPSLQFRGAIWSIALLCLQMIFSFWAFREFSMWRRTEELFAELFKAQSPRPESQSFANQ
jgi:hypothetical protein